MHVYSIATSRHMQAPLDIVRHPRLSGDAKSLLLWALSLPAEERATLTAIGEQMPFGKAAFSNARKQLIAEGYVLTRSWQDKRGLWASAVIVSDVPLLEPEAVRAAWIRASAESASRRPPEPPPEEPDEAPIAQMPPEVAERPVVEPEVVEEPPPVREEPPEDPPDDPERGGGWGFLRRRPSPDRRDLGQSPPRQRGTALREGTTREVTSLPRYAQAFENDEVTQLLRRIVESDRRLWMRPCDAVEMVPFVREWLARGATERELAFALLDTLPGQIFHAPRLLMDRLTRKMPPKREPRPLAPERHECAECCDPIPRPGLCRSCAGVPERVHPAADSRAEITLRGVAMVRAAFAPNTGRRAAQPA